MSSARQGLGPSAQGRSSGPIPSEPEMARMSTAPSLESRVNPLASSTSCAPASSPSLNFCAAIARQRKTAESIASGPCSRLIQNRATSAATGTQAAPRLSVRAIPGQIKTPPARANSARGHPRLAEDKTVHAKIQTRGIWKAGGSRFQLFRQRDKARVGQGHRPIRRSLYQRRAAKRGARLVDGQNAF